jgi:hypothetical protein
MGYEYLLIAAMIAAAPSPETGSQPPAPTPRDQEFRPRVGLVSEEVAREKLARYGVTKVTAFTLVNGTYEIHAEQDGRVVTLQLDATRGLLRERGQVLALSPTGAALANVPKPDPDQVKRLDELLRHEVRPALDRTPPHVHIRPEGHR